MSKHSLEALPERQGRVDLKLILQPHLELSDNSCCYPKIYGGKITPMQCQNITKKENIIHINIDIKF